MYDELNHCYCSITTHVGEPAAAAAVDRHPLTHTCMRRHRRIHRHARTSYEHAFFPFSFFLICSIVRHRRLSRQSCSRAHTERYTSACSVVAVILEEKKISFFCMEKRIKIIIDTKWILTKRKRSCVSVCE